MSAGRQDLAGLRAGGKAALARALTALEETPQSGATAALLDAALADPVGVAIGLTGPPGVGKSTLANALVDAFRTAGLRVGVIAVDPTSRISGGALLGDRVRMGGRDGDPGVFIRSMAAQRRLGGLAEITFPAMTLMRAVFDRVIVETVGVGQSETEIAECADLVALCVQPGAGDALQFMKAGVMETPDLALVTKGDMVAEAGRAAAALRGALSLDSGPVRSAPVAIVSAQTGDGLAQALEIIDALIEARRSSGVMAASRRAKAQVWVESRIAESFGAVGLAALAGRIRREESPFRTYFGLVSEAESRVREALRTL